MKKIKFICIAGKNNIAVDVLQYFLDNHKNYNFGVVCNQTETGKNIYQKSLRWFAQKNNIREYKLEELYEIEGLLFFSMEFDQIVKPEKFTNAKLYNIHFSLLPKYKGLYTSALPILNGEKESGVTFHRIDAGIDTGDIIDQKSFSIEGMDCRDIYLEYIRNGTEVVIKNIPSILAGTEISYQQPILESTYYSRKSIDYSTITVDLNQTADGIARQIRAYNFREYQLPNVNGYAIIDYAYTNMKSQQKPGQIILETESACIVSTIDYDIILYYDRLNQLLKSCKEGNIVLVKDICCVKKHINASEIVHGWTPLITATYYGQKEIVDYLLIAGADIFTINHNATTLLMYAKEAYKRTELVIDMVEKWRKGDNVVLAIRKSREESRKQILFAELYYWLVRKTSLPNMPKGGFDVYLIDRKVINVLSQLDERNSALTGQILWSGFRTGYVEYIRKARAIGESKWTLQKKVRLVSDTLFSFSTLPIKLVEIIGTLSFAGAIIWGIIVLVLKIMGVISVHGWTTLFIFMLFSFGMTMVTLGILGEYLWRTFDASRNRPTYIIEDNGFK